MATSRAGSPTSVPAWSAASSRALQAVDLGYGTGALPAEDAIRIMLADLEDADTVPLRLRLLDDFRHLRTLIG